MRLKLDDAAFIEAQDIREFQLHETKRSFPDLDPIRQIYITGIRRYVEKHSYMLTGRVLDFGAGIAGSCRCPQPYRNMVHGTYIPVDISDSNFQSSDEQRERDLTHRVNMETPYDSILCTQVFQYLPDGGASRLKDFYTWLSKNGIVLLTFATNWEEAENVDMMRVTNSGMMNMLLDAGFTLSKSELIAEVRIGNFHFPLGHGIIGHKG